MLHLLGRKKVQLKGKSTSSDKKIPISIEETYECIQTKLGHSKDIKIRYLQVLAEKQRVAVVYLETMVDQKQLSKLLESLLTMSNVEELKTPEQFADDMIKKQLPFSSISTLTMISEMIEALLVGNSILLMDRSFIALSISTSNAEFRSIEEPSVETEVRGTKESFIEDIQANVRLIRRKCKNEGLRILKLKIGEITNTEVNIVYIDGLANIELVQEVKRRISQIEIDGVLESFYIEEWIVDYPKSIFPQMNSTERPDKVVAMLLEGHVAIFVDGTPWSLIAPTVFIQFFTTSGDYYSNYIFSTFLRWIRIMSFLFSLTVPSLYIALSTMHQEMFPTTLALRIAGARSGVPFPAIFEALIMEISFEILREAGVRLPRVAGQAVSIVGALIIGQAAVDAGLVSPIMVIAVALTGISSFTNANYSLAMVTRILRFPLMIVASILGMPGITIALLMLLTYMASIKSFGVPYLSPIAPLTVQDLKDTIIRFPWKNLEKKRKIMMINHQNGSEFEVKEKE
ncbi:spore germination protein [Bacillus sp. FJAT-47783]|uniref:spore germination protein n=1 Tax=Bacillus sp. FJAT-47783 TaxID=2922712 RepID=UPI001FAC3D31|nr:spore germination protein [Bacillus sp. FJAT-47783]